MTTASVQGEFTNIPVELKVYVLSKNVASVSVDVEHGFVTVTVNACAVLYEVAPAAL